MKKYQKLYQKRILAASRKFDFVSAQVTCNLPGMKALRLELECILVLPTSSCFVPHSSVDIKLQAAWHLASAQASQTYTGTLGIQQCLSLRPMGIPDM